MSKKMASILIAYGMVLAGLGIIPYQTAPVVGKATFIAGFVGGGLCLLWGIAGLAGLKRRVWACLSAIGILLVLLKQAVGIWMPPASAEGISVMMRLVVTAMCFMTVGILLYLFHGERPPEFYNPGASRRDNHASH